MKKYSKKRNWNLMDPIMVWRIVQEGKELKVFPNNFLNQENCKILIRHLLLEDLKMSREEILCVDNNLLSSYNLGGIRKFFDCKIYKLLMFSFPELEINEWEVKKASPGIWKDEEIRKKYVKYIASKENIDLTKVEDLKKFSAKMIQTKYKGSKALKYSGGLFNLIHPVISNDIKEWQIFKVNNWTMDKAVIAMNWLINERLKWNEEQIYNNLKVKTFYDNDLGGLLSKFCHHCPLEAIHLIYPSIPKLKNPSYKKN